MLKTRQELKDDKYYQGVGSKLVLSGSTVISNFTGETSTYKNVGFDVRNFTTLIGGGFSSNVNGVGILGTGEIIAAGAFINYQDYSVNRIAKLSSGFVLDQTFNTNVGTGPNTNVNSLAIQWDNKIILVGSFTSFAGAGRSRIVRLNSNGTIDTSFNVGSGLGATQALCVAVRTGIPNTKVLVGGQFTSYNGNSSTNLVQINTDGSFDSTFNIGSGFGSTVNALAIQNDGKILAGGAFTTFTGTTQNRIIRLNSNGTKDTSFVIGTGFGTGTIAAIKVQSDGKIIVGGTFTTYSGVTCNRIVRLHANGKIDATFNMGTGFGGTVNGIQILSNGKIIVSGIFTTYNSATVSTNMVRLNSDGTLDTTFNVGGSGFQGNIGQNAVSIASDDKILAGGTFTSYNGKTVNRIIRLNPDGSSDTGDVNITVKNGIINYDSSYSNTKIGAKSLVPKEYVDNTYVFKNGLTRNVENLQPTVRLGGTIDEQVSMGGDGNFILQPGRTFLYNRNGTHGLVLNSGHFSVANANAYIEGGAANDYLATNDRLYYFDRTTGQYRGIVFTLANSFGGLEITSMVKDFNGRTWIAGDFSTAYNAGNPSPNTYNGLIRVSSGGNTIDTGYRGGTGFNDIVNHLVITGDSIVALGLFTQYSGFTVNQMVKLDSRGFRDESFSASTFTDSIAPVIYKGKFNHDEGKFYVCGRFESYSGVSCSNIIRLNPDLTIDESFVTGIFDGIITSFDQQSDGKILIGGQFRNIDGTPYGSIARLNTDGSVDNTFSTGEGFGEFDTVKVILYVADNDSIYVGGLFATYSASTINVNAIVRLNIDGSINQTFSGNSTNNFLNGLTDSFFGTGVVNSIELTLASRLRIVGQFDTYAGIYSAPNIITLSLDGEFIDTQSTITQMEIIGRLKYYGDESQYFTARSVPDVAFVTGLTSQLSSAINIDFLPTVGDILFDRPRKYGYNGLAVSGNITISTANALEIYEPKLIHNDSIRPTISVTGGGVTVTQTGTYVENVENEFYFKCHKNNAGVVTRITVFIYPNI